MASSSRRSGSSLRRLFPYLAILLVLCLMVSTASAQIDTEDLPDLSTAESLGDTTSTAKDAKETATREEATTTEDSGDDDAETPTPKPEKTTEATTTTDPTTVLGVTDTPTESISKFVITGAPSIAGVGVPTMQVPNTNNAPFMQKSNLPEGTVFICVGAALAFLGAAVLAWRGMVAWSLHRSVKRAALAYETSDSKPILRSHDHRSSHMPAYGSHRQSRLRGGNGSTTRLSSTVPRTGSVLSIDQLGNSGLKPGSRGNLTTAGGRDARSSLFFSPTASSGGHGHTASTGGASYMNPTNRSSGYLPAGFYAPGSSTPAGGASATHLGSGGGPGYTQLSNLGPGNGSQPRVAHNANVVGSRSVSGTSASGAPALPPSRGAESMVGGGANSSLLGNVGARESTPALYDQQVSSSSLNLAAGQQGRAPSAYLEDLFENHGNGPRERF